MKKLRGRRALKCKYYQRGSKNLSQSHLPKGKSGDRPEFSPRAVQKKIKFTDTAFTLNLTIVKNIPYSKVDNVCKYLKIMDVHLRFDGKIV